MRGQIVTARRGCHNFSDSALREAGQTVTASTEDATHLEGVTIFRTPWIDIEADGHSGAPVTLNLLYPSSESERYPTLHSA